ncbi:MAG: BatD family protein [Saprospiraceae bacterium]|nr:BatD family protein [Saprospiraceae bacterium]
MKSKYLIFILTLILGRIHSQVQFNVICDVKQVLTGSSFNVEFRLENAEGRSFSEPDFGGLIKISGPGRSMSTTIINGHMSSSVGYVYNLVGTKSGKYKIGSAQISVGSKIYKTNPITIEVIKPSQSTSKENISPDGSNGEIYLELSADKKEAYIGQQIVITTKLYTQVGINHIEAVDNNRIDKCDIEFIAGDFPVQREVVKGKEFLTKILSKIVLYPFSNGRLSIPSNTYRLILGDDGFGFGLKSLFYNTAKVVESNELVIDVLNLPEPRPSNFSGAVGSFKAEFSSLNLQYSSADAINCYIQIEGNGNFKKINPLINIADTLLDIMEPTTGGSIKVSDEKELIRSQKFDYLMIPKGTGNIDLNLSFCYFDPDQKKYIQLSDSNRIEITKTIGNNKIQIEGLRPIQIVSSVNYNVNYLWVVFAILFFIPVITGLILYRNSNIATNILFFIKHWIPFLKAKRRGDKQIVGSDETLILNLILVYPELKNCETLYQARQWISKQIGSNTNREILEIIDEYQVTKYNPNHTLEDLDRIISKFKEKV